MSIQELRFAWLILGLLVLAVILPWFSPLWLALGAVPWLVGSVALIPQPRAKVTAATLTAAVSAPPAFGTLAVLGAALFLTALVFSPTAALYLSAWAAAAILLAASRGNSVWLRRLLLGGAGVCVLAIVGLGGTEALLRIPSLARKTGTLQERAAWHDRYDRLWEHNLFGFRSRYETVPRKLGVKRVFATGDYFTHGHKVASADSLWPARLERELRHAYPQLEFEVINAGQDGWTLANEAELLRRLGWQFGPDLVVVQYRLSGVLPSGPDFQHGGIELLYRRARLLPLRFRTGLVASSALLSVLEDKFSRSTHAKGLFTVYQEGQPGWEQTKAALREIGDSSRARGAPVVLLIFPDLPPGEYRAETYPFRSIIDKVGAVASAAGLYVLDLVPAFAAQGGDWRRWWAVPYEAYPNSAAQAVAATALAEYVVRNGWFVAPAPQSGRR